VIALARDGNAEPCAVMILRDGGADPQPVVQRANETLAEYQRMRTWFVWPEEDFPRTSTQKPRISAIQQVVQARLRTKPEAAAVSSSVAELIARLKGKSTAELGQESDLETDLNLSSLDRVELLGAVFLGEKRAKLAPGEKKTVAQGILKSLVDSMYDSEDGEVHTLTSLFRLCIFLEVDISRYMDKGNEYLVNRFVPMLLAQETEVTQDETWLKLGKVCAERLEIINASEIDYDWTVPYEYNFSCHCDDCKDLAKFLDADAQARDFRMNEERRLHLKSKVVQIPQLKHEMLRENRYVFSVTKTHAPKRTLRFPNGERLLDRLRIMLNAA